MLQIVWKIDDLIHFNTSKKTKKSFCFRRIFSGSEPRGRIKVKTWTKVLRREDLSTPALSSAALLSWNEQTHPSWSDSNSECETPPLTDWSVHPQSAVWADLWATCYRCMSEPELQMFDMQQEMACSVWQLRFRLPLIATRRAGMNLQRSFVSRPEQNLWQSGSGRRCFVVWSEDTTTRRVITVKGQLNYFSFLWEV